MRPESIAALRRARDLIDRQYAEPVDLDAMAGAAGLSRHHFARSFRACFGETPGAYMSRRRVERAKDLLRSANLTVTEICLMVGFQSLGSFSSRFRELVGCSPTAYRHRQVAAHGGPPIPGCILMAWTRPGGGAAGRSGVGSAAAGLGSPAPLPRTAIRKETGAIPTP